MITVLFLHCLRSQIILKQKVVAYFKAKIFKLNLILKTQESYDVFYELFKADPNLLIDKITLKVSNSTADFANMLISELKSSWMVCKHNIPFHSFVEVIYITYIGSPKDQWLDYITTLEHGINQSENDTIAKHVHMYK